MKASGLAIGLIATVVGLASFVVLALLTILSANACGAFADGCDDYGKTAPGFQWFALGAGIALLVFLAGAVTTVAVVVANNRRRRSG